MTIYATPFDAAKMEFTGPSADSSFESIDAVVAALGDDYTGRQGNRVVYGTGNERVIFSALALRVDSPENND